MKTWKLKLHLISEEFFQYSLITYLILLLAETLQEGFVSFFFNLNILLVVVLISGIIMVLTHHEVLEVDKQPKKMTSADVQNAIFFAVIGGGFSLFSNNGFRENFFSYLIFNCSYNSPSFYSSIYGEGLNSSPMR